MKVTFDPLKRQTTLRERGLDFADAVKVFEGEMATVEDVRFEYPEHRFRSAGELNGRLVVIVWTPIAGGRRIISMRHVHASEAREWRKRMDRP